VVTLLLVGLALASAASTLEHLKDQIDQVSFSGSSGVIPATSLQSESLSGSLGSGSGSCSPDPCSNPISFGGGGHGDHGGGVDDAIRPVGEWLKDFQMRTMGRGDDLYQAAKATVRPLISKLHRNQIRAQERLKESNEAVLRHVEEATTNHIYALLKADHSKDEHEQRREEHAARIMEAKEKAKEDKANMHAKLGVSEASALESALKSSGVSPSQSVLSSIAKLISSESASASASLASALKAASAASK